MMDSRWIKELVFWAMNTNSRTVSWCQKESKE